MLKEEVENKIQLEKKTPIKRIRRKFDIKA
jgi:hypothetical protein